MTWDNYLNMAAGVMFAILFTHLSMALFRSPTITLPGDLFPARPRNTANGIINLMGGLGSILTFVVGGLLYRMGRVTPFAFGSLVILCWFLGYSALETRVSSFGKFSLGIDEGRMALLTSGLALMFVIFVLPSGLIATRYGRRPVILSSRNLFSAFFKG
jgi:maltose/moltooligosaccharide transporter